MRSEPLAALEHTFAQMIHHSLIYQDYFGTEAMRALWNEERMVQRWLDFEAAVALAEGELGIIPKETAEVLARNCTAKLVTPEAVREWRKRTGHVIVSLIKTFADVCPHEGEAFHLGPTTQDVLDTGLTLQIRDSLVLLLPAMLSLTDVLFERAVQYRKLAQIGRSEGQHATPITFGYKLAVIGAEMGDHVERLVQCSERLLILTLFGATGVQSSFLALTGKAGVGQLAKLVAGRLGLKVPSICPHQRTDRFAELGNVLSLVLATLGEAGLEIRDLQRTEVAEVFEPYSREQHSSSTMPQKRNPEVSEWWDGLAKVGAGHALALASIRQQHERDITRLPPELVCIPSLFLYCSAAVDAATRVFSGLEVGTDAMARNLEAARGMAMAESVMFALFRKSGRKVWAHQLCHELALNAAASGHGFRKELDANSEIQRYLSSEEIDAALSVHSYTGTAAEQVEAAAADWRQKKEYLLEAMQQLGVLPAR